MTSRNRMPRREHAKQRTQEAHNAGGGGAVQARADLQGSAGQEGRGAGGAGRQGGGAGWQGGAEAGRGGKEAGDAGVRAQPTSSALEHEALQAVLFYNSHDVWGGQPCNPPRRPHPQSFVEKCKCRECSHLIHGNELAIAHQHFAAGQAPALAAADATARSAAGGGACN